MQALAAQYVGNRSFEILEGRVDAPSAGEVRLRVGYVGICGTDMHIYHGLMDHRVQPPQVVGHEMSGVVDAVGADVTGFSVGDRVVVRPLDYCGDCPACREGYSHICHNLKFMGVDSEGAFQSYWNVKARTLHKLPEHVSLKQGALIEPLAVACHDVSRARLKAGEKAVILGGGPIGQLIAQVAIGIGAEVMISEPSPERRSFATSNGVLAVNPVEQDLKSAVDEWTGGKGADVVFEVSGVQPAVDVMTEIAAVRGRICMVAIHSSKPQVDVFKFFWRELELVGARVYEAEDFERAIDMVADGKIDLEPFISKVAQLDQIDSAFSSMDGNPSGMKALVSCGADG
ncbi:zinc-dependent alcohol dehydrogenase [Microbulbifer thermotolerans]|uniref:Alcohol dehydrogenase catalytic domain-containing protein n=1 Tax=Microbulbifer thermotolerans TaxID=252514 RepID=A0A143HMY9_MICTH|nr:alcohol dehydrogenase catalytic domain-containing protein [Microbulbifer thermotolerans]AMX02877.1 Zn-dependent alcohol dehydrogenase [Microbulbifer thermotolerans]MCX2780498.1 alcohol dehydrogenase catalytic domain-containing protein [Microbulbifer thermotolerans]MCX2784097.1 alcohol dehydrogenase catalytic domain-containing protein [Microbulbifer thermotolerans]MCX2794866.1 alcohol dehydrogenase catalytic domain-containing protein [Microbulbifer thermotolerans]MCX2803058.1 alcohol dehydro